MLGPAVCCASTGPRPGASEPGLEPKPPGLGSDGGTGVDTGDGTRSPVLDRRKAGFDRAGGGDSSSLDVLGNLLGKLPQTPSCSTSRPLLLLVLRLGERLGTLLGLGLGLGLG